MWFTFVTARLFIFLSFQPRLTATLLRSCSVVNNPIRRMGLAPMFKPASPAQALFPSLRIPRPPSRRAILSRRIHHVTAPLGVHPGSLFLR